MKTKVLEPKKIRKPVSSALREVAGNDTFEKDWKNGMSGDEFVKKIHEHIKEWWRANRANGRA